MNLLAFKTLFVQYSSRDFLDKNGPKPGPTPTSSEELLARFDEYAAILRKALSLERVPFDKANCTSLIRRA